MPRQTKIELLLSQKPAAVLAVKNAEAALRSARAALRTLEADYMQACKRASRRAAEPRYKYLASVRDSHGDSMDCESFSAKWEAVDWAKRNLKTVSSNCGVEVERVTLSTMTYVTVWTGGNQAHCNAVGT
jgi:hypothetical protein